jgi:predicted transcriptional regulator
MTALTVRLPDEKHRRLKALAKSRGTPLNRLIDEVTTLLLAEFDAETRFRIRAERGTNKSQAGLALLKKAAGD